MLYQITDGTVSPGGKTVLNHIDFEIRGNEKIAVTGKNGAGKTTLLQVIAGELELDGDDRRTGPGIRMSRQLTIGMLRQQPDPREYSRTVEELILDACPARDTLSRERFDYETEYDTIFTRFGFSKQDKQKKLSEFSGGQQTRISLIRLLLARPDILLLDEPTNHLDLETVQWLERYIRQYPNAAVIVSHDRFFLDQTADTVYELAGGKLTRYPGNYTDYRKEKAKRLERERTAWQRRQEEIRRLEELIERFKHKPAKASFARSRKTLLERLPSMEKPEEDDIPTFAGPVTPLLAGSKWVLEAEHLSVGYDAPLAQLSLRIRRGQKIGILGPNGAGKSTFLKTAAGLLPPLKGRLRLGNQITVGYFDQHSAEISSDQTVIEHFHSLFPALTDREVRSVLGSYLFGGKAAGQRVSSLSGGEKARLVLAELLQSRPNFLILDEPTNHMDIRAKEALEAAFRAYKGTILFVSHDRYFLRQVAESILIFESGSVLYYPFGYQHYLDRLSGPAQGDSVPARVKAEDQALIAGIQAVPRAERHMLREIPTEEAYADWQLRLAGQRLEGFREKAEIQWTLLEDARRAWTESEAFWEESCAPAPGLSRLQQEYEGAWQAWHEECLTWYDTAAPLLFP